MEGVVPAMSSIQIPVSDGVIKFVFSLYYQSFSLLLMFEAVA